MPSHSQRPARVSVQPSVDSPDGRSDATSVLPGSRATAVTGPLAGSSPPDNGLGQTPGSQSATWPDLVPVGYPDLPAFPVDALPRELRDYARAVSAETQTPVDAAAMLSLSVVSAVSMGKARAVGHPGHREELMLYVIVGMHSAERKTAVLNLLLEPVFEVERAMRQRQEPERLQKLAQVAKAKDDLKRLRREAAKDDSTITDEQITAAMAEAEAEAVPPVGRLVLSTATPEALVEAMAENDGKIALFSDESSIFGVLAGRYAGRGGSVDLDPFLHGYNAGRIRSARIGRRTGDVEHARLAMGLVVQPSAFDELSGVRDADGRGLLGRPIYSLPGRVAGTRVYGQQQAIDPMIKLAYTERVRALGEVPTPCSPVDLRCTPDALALYTAFANRHEPRLATDGDLAHIPSWAGKHVGAVLRIAALLTIWRSALTEPFAPSRCHIQPEDVEAAVLIGEYLVPHALAALGAIGEPDWMKIAHRILSWLKRKEVAPWSERECFTALAGPRSRVQTMNDLRPALGALIERGYIRPCKPTAPTRGRPASPNYETNPALFDL
jgi:replicative DNA helicase